MLRTVLRIHTDQFSKQHQVTRRLNKKCPPWRHNWILIQRVSFIGSTECLYSVSLSSVQLNAYTACLFHRFNWMLIQLVSFIGSMNANTACLFHRFNWMLIQRVSFICSLIMIAVTRCKLSMRQNCRVRSFNKRDAKTKLQKWIESLQVCESSYNSNKSTN
jgi:hypothetical protein